jgi:hypothetical protein
MQLFPPIKRPSFGHQGHLAVVCGSGGLGRHRAACLGRRSNALRSGGGQYKTHRYCGLNRARRPFDSGACAMKTHAVQPNVEGGLMKLIIASALLAVGLVHGTYAAPAPGPGKPIPAQTVKPRATAVAPVAPAGTVKSQGKPTVPIKPQADTHYCCGPGGCYPAPAGHPWNCGDAPIVVYCKPNGICQPQ